MTQPRPWPFKSSDQRMAPEPTARPVNGQQPVPDYCNCDLELTGEEMDKNKCSACGRRIA